VQTR
jgi:hypothetical protein